MDSQGQNDAKTEAKYHVLLIGIDDYPLRPLAGCVNDIDAVQRLLLDSGLGITADSIRRLASPGPDARPDTTIPSKAASFANIRAALDELASKKVRPTDRVFIYYSGHGKRVPVIGREGRTFQREALVPVDFTTGGTQYAWLYDYEVNQRLRAIAERTPQVTVVLDCCNAAGAFRDFDDPGDTNRTIDIDLAPVPDPVPDHAPDPARAGAERGGLDPDAAWLGRGIEVCHVVAACLEHEGAKESSSGGRRHGLLTSAFLAALRPIAIADRPQLTWARIWQAMRAEVMRGNALQTPRMEGSAGRLVFSGPPVHGDAGIPVAYDGALYLIAAGTMAEIDQDAELAIYDAEPAYFPPLDSDADRASRRGVIRVTAARPSSADAVAVGTVALRPGGRARLIKPAQKLRFAVQPPSPEIAKRVAGSPLVELVALGGPDDRTLPRLERHGERWLVIDDLHGNGSDAPVLFGLADDELTYVRAVLEHYHAYSLPMRMADRAARDLRDGLELRLLACGPDGHDLTPDEAKAEKLDEVRLDHGIYRARVAERVCIYVRNRATVPLKVALFDAASEGEVQMLGDNMIGPGEYHVFWAQSIVGKPYTMPLPDGVDLARDRLVAIGRSSPQYELDYLRVDQTFADVVNRGDQQMDDDAQRRLDDGTRLAATERWTAVQAVLEISRR